MSGLEIYRPAYPDPYDPGPFLTRLGDVSVHERAILTPVGMWPLQGSVWTLAQQPMPTQKTSTAGVVLAVISAVLAFVLAFFTCGISMFLLFGLFFLMMKETVLTGPAVIAVRSGRNLYHAQEFPTQLGAVHHLINRVNYCQALASMPTGSHYG